MMKTDNEGSTVVGISVPCARNERASVKEKFSEEKQAFS
jgi:hypothetical protein